jgi:hypothetical protein
MLSTVSGGNGDVVFCELRFRPNVRLVSVVRRFVESFYALILKDPATTDRMALATHELLENAVKYSSDGETGVRVEVDQKPSPWEIRIRTWNRACPEDISVLEQRSKRFSSAADMFTLYQELMAEASKRDEGSGLGLARICSEAEMQLAFEIDESQVCVLARASVERPEDVQ